LGDFGNDLGKKTKTKKLGKEAGRDLYISPQLKC